MKKNSGNILLIILAITGILAASVGGYFWWKSKTTVPVTKQTFDLKSKEVNPSNDEIKGWKTLINKYGWSVKYPPDWEIVAPIAPPLTISPEEAGGLTITGPKNCFQNGLRCGAVSFDAIPQQAEEISSMTPRQFLLQKTKTTRTLVSSDGIDFNGLSGYQAIFNDTNAGFHPNGEISKEIALKHRGKIFQITLTEDYKDRSAIKSMTDWKLTTIFDQILSTFRFLK